MTGTDRMPNLRRSKFSSLNGYGRNSSAMLASSTPNCPLYHLRFTPQNYTITLASHICGAPRCLRTRHLRASKIHFPYSTLPEMRRSAAPDFVRSRRLLAVRMPSSSTSRRKSASHATAQSVRRASKSNPSGSARRFAAAGSTDDRAALTSSGSPSSRSKSKTYRLPGPSTGFAGKRRQPFPRGFAIASVI